MPITKVQTVIALGLAIAGCSGSAAARHPTVHPPAIASSDERDPGPPPNDSVVMHVAEAREHTRVGDRERATASYQAARDLCEGVEAEDAIDARGEAIFYLAEDEYAAASAIPFPQPPQPADIQTVTQWGQTQFAGWYHAKVAAIRSAEVEYERIATLSSPRWTVAATARIGEMYRELVTEFRAAPVPAEMAKDKALEDAYEAALASASQPFEDHAIEMFESCRATAQAHGIDNENARACERAIAP